MMHLKKPLTGLKLIKSFDMATVDWTELNSSKSAAKSYKAIDWANVSISSDVSAQLIIKLILINFHPLVLMILMI